MPQASRLSPRRQGDRISTTRFCVVPWVRINARNGRKVDLQHAKWDLHRFKMHSSACETRAIWAVVRALCCTAVATHSTSIDMYCTPATVGKGVREIVRSMSKGSKAHNC